MIKYIDRTMTNMSKADWSSTAVPVSWTSSVVTAITTYVPSACTFTHAGKTYSPTGPSTITITDCRKSPGIFLSDDALQPDRKLTDCRIACTVSVPVYTSTSTSCTETKTPVVASSGSASSAGWGAPSSPAAPVAASSAPAGYSAAGYSAPAGVAATTGAYSSPAGK